MQAHLLCHLQRIIVTKLTIKDKIDHAERIANLLQHLLHVRLNKTKRRAELYLATITILAPFGTPARATRRLRFRRRGLHRYLQTLVYLFSYHRIRGAMLYTEQG